MTIPPLPKSFPEQRNFIGQVNRAGATNLIAEILAAQPHTSFHLFLVRILENLQEQNQAIAFKDGASIPKVAWAGRNAMELRVLVRYGCRSAGNLQRFQADSLISGPSILQALSRIGNDFAKQVGLNKRVPARIYRGRARIQAMRVQAGLEDEPPLMAKTCAKRVGMEKEYLAFSSATSPLVHPSSLTVLKSFDLESCRVWLVLLSLKLVSDTILDVRKHIEKYAFRHVTGKVV